MIALLVIVMLIMPSLPPRPDLRSCAPIKIGGIVPCDLALERGGGALKVVWRNSEGREQQIKLRYSPGLGGCDFMEMLSEGYVHMCWNLSIFIFI